MTIEQRLQQKPFNSVEERAFVHLLYVSGVLMQRLDEQCARHSITHTQYNVLRILRGVYPEGHPRVEIINRLITRAPDVTRLLDRLERQGLIERTWSKENRRLSIAKITKSGLELLGRMDPDVKRVQRESTGKLSAAQCRELCQICDQIAG